MCKLYLWDSHILVLDFLSKEEYVHGIVLYAIHSPQEGYLTSTIICPSVNLVQV